MTGPFPNFEQDKKHETVEEKIYYKTSINFIYKPLNLTKMDPSIIFIIVALISLVFFILKIMAVGWVAKKVINNSDFFDFNHTHKVKTDNLNLLTEKLSSLQQTIHDGQGKGTSFDEIDDQFKQMFLLLKDKKDLATMGIANIEPQSQQKFIKVLGKILEVSNNMAKADRMSRMRYESNMGSIYSAAGSCGVNPNTIGR